jgi:glutamyl-tRNA reductase
LRTFPTVISATSAKRRLIDDVSLAGVVAARKDPLLLIDMAMPPDFTPPETSRVTYLDIDDLARMADRRTRSEGADALVAAAAADAYRQYRDHHEIGPLISGMMDGADLLVEETVRRFSGRLRSPEDETALRQAVHTVARKLLAGPVGYLKKEDRSAEAIDVIADAFGVDGE